MNGGDEFRLDPTQWFDTDGDGFGDELDGFEEISVRMFTASPSTIDSVALIPIEMAGLTQMRIGRLKMEQMRTSTIH